MALKNYTTEVPASRSVQEIQEILQKHGVTGTMMEYEQGTGRIESLAFKIDINGQPWGFRMPLRWRQALQTLYRGKKSVRSMYSQQSRIVAAERVREEYAYRVAWRILRDWVDVQMALVELDIVQIQEVFLPYVVQENGQTLFENIVTDPSRLLT
jgi:hypothetical protein